MPALNGETGIMQAVLVDACRPDVQAVHVSATRVTGQPRCGRFTGTKILARALLSSALEVCCEDPRRPRIEARRDRGDRPDGRARAATRRTRGDRHACLYARDLGGWDAVIVGGALYAGRWLRPARRFVERHADELAHMPVWLFSSGPLDDSATRSAIPPTRQVQRLIARVHARGHRTFGGRLATDAKGFIARALVRQQRAGDWRHRQAIDAWARTIADELATLGMRERGERGTDESARQSARHQIRRALAGLCLFTGLTAAAGGLFLLHWPDGAPWTPGFTPAVLTYASFSDFTIPGALLFGPVGALNVVGGILAWRRHTFGEVVAFAGGGATTIWIVVEMLLLRTVEWLQIVYLVIGPVTMGFASWA